MKVLLILVEMLVMGIAVIWLRGKAKAEQRRDREHAEKLRFFTEILK